MARFVLAKIEEDGSLTYMGGHLKTDRDVLKFFPHLEAGDY